ncbi:MAG: nucleoside 2-deoxyribosyltransferase [Pseudomonadales bacterium]|nr:nucleoside 2-deoxyribosyltransferase [Pseudomonadales bacterium]
MSERSRIYLAGPEVFFPEVEHRAIVEAKKRILAGLGLEGVDPMDTELEMSGAETKRGMGRRIFLANRRLMDSCVAVIANLTPFRGISADPGTVFEVGYMVAQGKLACGFSMEPRNYFLRAGGQAEDSLGHTVEPFELADNLMIECGIEASGGRLVTPERATDHRWFDEEIFARCAALLKIP